MPIRIGGARGPVARVRMPLPNARRTLQALTTVGRKPRCQGNRGFRFSNHAQESCRSHTATPSPTDAGSADCSGSSNEAIRRVLRDAAQPFTVDAHQCVEGAVD